MRALIHVMIVLAAILAAFVPSVAHAKPRSNSKGATVQKHGVAKSRLHPSHAATVEAKESKKSSAVKVHMCESVDVYTGAVDADHPSTRIANECKDVAPAAAQRAINKCAKEGAEKCEVLFSADNTTLFIEHKIVAAKVPANVTKATAPKAEVKTSEDARTVDEILSSKGEVSL